MFSLLAAHSCKSGGALRIVLFLRFGGCNGEAVQNLEGCVISVCGKQPIHFGQASSCQRLQSPIELESQPSWEQVPNFMRIGLLEIRIRFYSPFFEPDGDSGAQMRGKAAKVSTEFPEGGALSKIPTGKKAVVTHRFVLYLEL